MRLKLYILAGIVLTSLSSCWKEDDAFVLPASNGNTIPQQVTLGENYDKIAFYNINEQKFILKNLADWDLGFAGGQGQWHIIVNGGREILVHETGLTQYPDTYTLPAGAEWRYDATSGNTDSTAIGKWWQDESGLSTNTVYVLDMGLNYQGTSRYKKLQILGADNTGFTVKVGDLKEAAANTYFIPKDSSRNYNYLDVTTGAVHTDLEPEKNTWDIVFTRYRYVFFDMNPPIPYIVTGVLLNPNGVTAYEERKKTFEEVDLAYARTANLTTRQDVIGYEWKSYSIPNSRYTTDPTRIYIIKTISGYYYKMRFTDFYNDLGIKGTPSFEIQRL